MGVISKIKREIKESMQPKKLANSLKTIMFFLLSIVNAVGCTLIGFNIITVGSIPVLVITGLSSVFLFLATRSDDIARIIEKYDILGEQVRVRLNSIGEFTQDLNFLKQEIDSIRSNTTIPTPNNEPINEPIQLSGRAIENLQTNYTSKYDARTDTIYFSPRPTFVNV